jgi:hypothetical protein
MDLHDARRASLFVEVDVKRDEARLVLLDERGVLRQELLGLFELARPDRPRSDVHKWRAHLGAPLLLVDVSAATTITFGGG